MLTMLVLILLQLAVALLLELLVRPFLMRANTVPVRAVVRAGRAATPNGGAHWPREGVLLRQVTAHL